VKIFVICPVRNLEENMREHIELEVTRWEAEGHQVHLPYRDTNQADSVGLNICKENRTAIEAADEVRIFWDGQSTGSLFDLGMAFALRKPIHPAIGCFPRMTNGKSFQNMVYAWEERGAD
jgi:nucleoside 2-deoxyribosyltransferase